MSMWDWVLPLASVGVKAVSQVKAGKAQAAADNYNAELAERDAVISRQNAAFEEQRFRRMSRKRLGEMTAGFGASGFTIGGSALVAIADSAAQEELDALTIRYQGELKAVGYGESAALDRSRAKDAKRAGYFGAGSELLLGAANYYDKLTRT